MLPVKTITVSSVDAVYSLPKSIDGHSLHLEDLCNFFLEYQVRRVLLNGVCILDLQVYIFFQLQYTMSLCEPHFSVHNLSD